jgi:hypothetical protein
MLSRFSKFKLTAAVIYKNNKNNTAKFKQSNFCALLFVYCHAWLYKGDLMNAVCFGVLSYPFKNPDHVFGDGIINNSNITT